ncbi:hypothetical protein [Zophobihabitans entericus]|uniref:Uncharacterized protein n=1 Tax=Zophobihabitans entericus TaxID=1635327 RepID=A0A6G9ICV8_9GAMM|nr:hypothetical protein [Zophobihabitans entericus]QIQ22068.1 hypothetical protein IPMB12_10455 [Zophobihabitans entericus]
MRLFIASLFILLLSSCSMARTAEDAFKEGRYLESVELIAQYMEETGQSKLTGDDIIRFQTIIQGAMSHYENDLLAADRTDYARRIDDYKALLTMKNRIGSKFYSQQVYFFNNKYEVLQLRQLIAEEYYLYGKSLKPQTSKEYYQQASIYKSGLEQYKYKDIETLYNASNKKYMELAASEFYTLGQQFAKDGSYKEASEQFKKASDVYKPLGKYKDSQTLYVEYDRKYRTAEAKGFYQQAQALAKTARTHKQYREVADLYKQAIDIYKPYGQYLDATTLQKQYADKGIVKIFVESSYYTTLVRTKLVATYVKFVDSSAAADVIVKADATESYKQTPPRTSVNAMSENVVEKVMTLTNPDGSQYKQNVYKTYYFNQRITESQNQYTVKTTVRAYGAISYSNSNTVTRSSKQTEYKYEGDVPTNYRNSTSGELLTRSKLSNLALEEAKNTVYSDLNTIIQLVKEL